MPRNTTFAVLQNTDVGPSAEQLKRAFRSFHNLTDADAIRLAVGGHGVLLRQANRDAARAFQAALQAEGVAATVVSEPNLPPLPPGISLHRLQLTPEAMITYDVLGRPKPVAWPRLGLIAAAAVRHFELTRTRTGGGTFKSDMASARWTKSLSEMAHKVEADSQLVLEIVLADNSARYQIAAAEFPFKHVINRPRLSTAAKFTWLVREICRRAPGALRNQGARFLQDGQDNVPEYMNPQMLTDEMVWMLWHATPSPRR